MLSVLATNRADKWVIHPKKKKGKKRKADKRAFVLYGQAAKGTLRFQ